MKGGGRENGEKILENGGHYSQGKEDEQRGWEGVGRKMKLKTKGNRRKG